MDPLFITGLHKSGTTWMANLLRDHPEIFVRWEGGFLDHEELLSTPGRRLENLPEDESIEHIVRAYVGRWMDKPWNHWGDGVDRDRLLDRLVDAMIGVVVDEAVTAGGGSFRYWADKTPRTPVAEIRRRFPRAKVVYMMRDPRDRAISLYHHCLRTEPWVVEASEGCRRMRWDEAFRAWEHDVRSNEASFDDPACLVVRYEDLAENGDAQLRRLLEFLGVKRTPDLVATLLRAASFEVQTEGRRPGEEDLGSFFRLGLPGQWRTFDEPRKLTAFQDIADTARAFGYQSGD